MTNDITKFEPLWGQWRADSLIGEGSFGRVYKVFRNDFGLTYYSAVKHISIPQNQSQADMALEEGYGTDNNTLKEYFRDVVQGIISEIDIMNKLQGNSNIVSYSDHLIVEKKDAVGWDIFIRMELLTPLSKYINKNAYSVQDVMKIGIDICKGLERCHGINLLHRDIKPSNIFVSDNGDYKLGDFGISRQIEKTTLGLSRKGTPLYMAPEVYLGGAYNSSVDTYSLAVVLYRFLNNNRLPFVPATGRFTQGDNEKALDRRISGEIVPPPVNADSKLSDIICKACSFEPKDRYESAKALRTDLEACYSVLANQAPIIIGGANLEPDANTSNSTSTIGSSQTVLSSTNYANTLPEGEGTVGLGANIPKTVSSEPSVLEEELKAPLHDDINVPQTTGKDEGIFKRLMTSIKNSKKKKALVIIIPLLLLILVSSILFAALPRNTEKYLLTDISFGEIHVGETMHFSVTDAVQTPLVWESSNPAIAIVNSNGDVTGVAPGSATVWVSTQGSTLKTALTVNVKAVLSSILLNKEATAILIGAQETLIARADTQNIDLPALVWESSNPLIATVDQAGTVTAIAEGLTDILVRDVDSRFSAKCTITVQATAIPIESIVIEPATMSLVTGQAANLTYTFIPANATSQPMTMVSSDASVASVDATGLVTALKAGAASITVQNQDGTILAVCQITVGEPSPTPVQETVATQQTVAPQQTTSAPKQTTAAPASWSDWMSALPAGVSDANSYLETKTQYRSRQQISQTSDWSAWQSTDPSGANRTVEKQYQYRTKAYTTNTAATLAGWTQYGTPAVTYGAWSGWSTTAATASSVLAVESQDVGVKTYKTVYYYNCWRYLNEGLYYCSYVSGWGGLPGEWLYKTSDTPLTQTGTYDGHAGYNSGGVIYFNQTSGQVETGTVYHKEYRTRSITTTYNYWQWGAWTAWTNGNYTGTTTDTEIVYQYHYKETTSSWGEWSAWSDTAVAASTTTEIQTQTLYRYKQK